MQLIQLFLPLYDNSGNPFSSEHYTHIRQELIEHFGGLTAFTRAPAEGLWKENEHHVARDDIVIFEVMLEQLDEKWWREYKASLEARFIQEEIVIRVQDMRLI